MLRDAIGSGLLALLTVSCTTVTPGPASHPVKSPEAQQNDKLECWWEAGFVSGHNPELSSPMGSFWGYFAAGIPPPRGSTKSAADLFQTVYSSCMTQRGYAVQGPQQTE
jgi:hypothetical protein